MLQLSLLDVYFVLLLCLVALARRLCPVRYYPVFGAVVSATLVGLASWQTLVVIAGITLLYLWPVHLLWRGMKVSESPYRKWLLAGSIGGLILLLVLFKTYRLFTVPFFGGLWRADRVLRLVGFSYFVLRAIGFLHIQSILDFRERTPVGLLFFMLFPPTITSGPIQKYQDFAQQLGKPLPSRSS